MTRRLLGQLLRPYGFTLPDAVQLSSPMLVGARAKDQDGATESQLQASFTRVNTLFGGTLNLTRGFEQTLPTTPQYVSPSGVLEIVSYHDRPTSNATLTTYVTAMRSPAYLVYHHEPEADYDSFAKPGATFVSQFRGQYEVAKAARPDLMFGMIAGGYQYGAGKKGADGSFLPPPDECDFYAIDTYRSGASTTATGFGALVSLDKVAEFQTWYGYVKDRGKPLYVTEYGRGFSYSAGQTTSTGATWTQAQVNNVLAKRPNLMTTDAAYLRSLGFAGMNLWYTNHSPGDDWMFTDQPSIDAWTAVAAG